MLSIQPYSPTNLMQSSQPSQFSHSIHLMQSVQSTQSLHSIHLVQSVQSIQPSQSAHLAQSSFVILCYTVQYSIIPLCWRLVVYPAGPAY